MALEDNRRGVMGGLLLTGIFTICLLIYGLKIQKYDIVVGCLAVIASCLSAAFAYDVTYQAKITQLPSIIVEFDCDSRYQLWQLFVKNVGGGTAYHVTLDWIESNQESQPKIIKPVNRDREVICFSKEPIYNHLVALPKGGTHYIWVDEFYNFFELNKPAYFIALISFQEKMEGGTVTTMEIPLSLESSARTLTYVKEIRRTEYEIQKIPDELKKINDTLKTLTKPD